MTTTSPETMAPPSDYEIVQNLYTDHLCRYAEQVLGHTTLEGSLKLRPEALHYMASRLAILHSDGTCPPTHIDNSPTAAWEEIVQGLRR